MSVTLDAWKFSGWLNASAYCRVERRAHAMPGEVRAGKQEVAAAQVACRGRTLLKAGGARYARR